MSFDDLDDALLELILKWLDSTQLRNSAFLVCKRWWTLCSTRPGLWRTCDINVSWEIYNPHGLSNRSPAASSLAVHHGLGRGSSRNYSGNGCSINSSRNPYGRRGGGHSGSCSSRPAFLSRAALSRWLWPYAPYIEVLCISHTEIRTTVVDCAFRGPDRHDLQPSDLKALLAALPSLTELHLVSACDLLPDPAALVLPQPPQPTPSPPLTAAQEPALDPTAAAAAAAALGTLALPPPMGLSSGATPLPERLRRLSLCRAAYDFQSESGAEQAAALGGLRALQELSLTLDPAAPEGLQRLPEAWSALTGLTALRLGGHQRLRRLPSWLSSSLRRLRELWLDSCGLYRVPAAALAGLPQLRLLSLDRCPLGRGSAAVSLDAWWPPEEEGRLGAAAADAGGESGTAVGSHCSDGGVAGLEVLQLRHCDILALPYTVTRLTNLRRLELAGNPLGELALPPIDGDGRRSQMRDVVLRYLRESGDRGFRQLAASPRLEHLGLERCGLGAMPLGVPELTQLTSLDLSDNVELGLHSGRVAELPERLPRLTSLRLSRTAAWEQLRRTGLDLGLHKLALS